MKALAVLALGRFSPIESRGWTLWAVASAALLYVRYWLAQPFWNSGQTKWDSFPFDLSDGAIFLFQWEYKLNLGFTRLDMPFPTLMAWMSGYAEIIFPVLLVLGLFTRVAALGLLGTTIIIQFVYPSAWLIHGSWALAALILIVAGGGLVSLDTGVRRLLGLPLGK